MHGPAISALYNHCSSIIPFTNPHRLINITYNFPQPQRLGLGRCRASASPITEFNLYELLGIDASADTSEIKGAYRALQKRCHPDIAGPPGHDMAILLNEAYALLCDPVSRMAYDKELAKVVDLQGFTGKPIYSVWVGSEIEERAVFVDEVKCIGCLKCALLADKTFAVETVYGRARVVAQWADPESNIQQAIAACPVDCISMVERSDLAALEFIMSKQPRGRVRIGAGNTAGVRTADVFDELVKFKARYANYNASKNYSKESEAYKGIRAIQMLTNWLYWNSPGTSDAAPLALAVATRNWKLGADAGKYNGETIKKLKAAAAARRNRKGATTTTSDSTEYWEPLAIALPTTPTPDSGSKPLEAEMLGPNSDDELPSRPMKRSSRSSPLRRGVPMAASIVAATVVRLQQVDAMGGSGQLEDHVGGSLALAIVNSSWMQVGLAAATWYLIVMYIVEFVEAALRLRRKI